MYANDKIIKKVKGLLALANDTPNDEESQAAFLLAQKLMIKHNILQKDVDATIKSRKDGIDEVAVTSYKTLFWWEKTLAAIISKNFRVKSFYEPSLEDKYQYRAPYRIMFYGFGGDLELAKEMYLLAYEVLVFHTKKYVEESYAESQQPRDRYLTASLKASYTSGFLSGLEERFAEQVASLQKEYPLLVLIPHEVVEAYAEFSVGFGTASYGVPNAESAAAYSQGARDGRGVDFTRSSVGTAGGSF